MNEFESVAEEVFDQAYGPHLRNPDFDWGRVDRLTAMHDRIQKCLEGKGVTDGRSQLQEVINDVVTERLSLLDIQSKLRCLIDLADDKFLRDKFASFLDAPLGSDEEKVAARAAICSSLEFSADIHMAPNCKETMQATERVFEAARDLWLPDHREKLVKFLTRFVSFVDAEQREKQRRDVEAMAEGHVKDRLDELYLALEKYTWIPQEGRFAERGPVDG